MRFSMRWLMHPLVGDLMIVVLLLLCGVALLTSCGETAPSAAAAEELPIAQRLAQKEAELRQQAKRADVNADAATIARTDADNAKRDVDDAKDLLHKAENRAKELDAKAARLEYEKAMAPVMSAVHWIEILSVLAGCLGGAAWLVLSIERIPVGHGIAMAFTFGGVAMFMIAGVFGIGVMHPWICAGIVIAALAAGGLWAILHHARSQVVSQEVHGIYDRAVALVKTHVNEDVAAGLQTDLEARLAQRGRGVAKLYGKARASLAPRRA